MYYPTLKWYHSIVIDHTKVPADISSMSVTLTQANFNNDVKTLGGTRAPGTSGQDLRFFSDANLMTPLPFDMIRYSADANPANTLIEIVVQVSVSSSTDTTIYVGWGDSTLSLLTETDTFGQYNTYKSGYKLWCPMRDDPDTSHVKDRTSNALVGNKKGTASPAQGTTAPTYINEYLAFLRSDTTYVEFDIINTGGQFIVFAPFDYTGAPDPSKDRIVSCKATWNQTSGFEVTLSTTVTGIEILSSGSTFWVQNVFSNVKTDGWETLAVRFNNTNCDIFVNSSKTVGSGVLSTVSNSTSKLQVGYNSAHDDSPISAKVDNVIIYVGTLLDAEIQAMQNNQRSPSTFIKTVGATHSVGPYWTSGPISARRRYCTT